MALVTLSIALASMADSAAASPGSDTPIDPCSLLTKTDARAILGEPVTDARKKSEVGFTPAHKCSYFTSAPLEKRGAVYGVSLLVSDEATFKKMGSYFKDPKQAFYRNRKGLLAVKKPNQQLDISGVGDAAYWDTAPGRLHVLFGDVYLIVYVAADFHIPPGTSKEVRAKEDAAMLKAEKHVVNTIILPRLHKLK